ncbi:MAG: cobalamin-binding protein [Gammaproteobacteria bacterium]|nr:MAG: cobalamin-binding protein [Gammaproteobacteria bacterium]
MKEYLPNRIVCLTEETTELLYLLGEQDRIVGISGFTVRPARARKEKPRVSAFTSAKIDKILELKPDLVLGFSDMQADIAAELVRQGVSVHIFNQRSIDEILSMIIMLGAMVGAQEKARVWVDNFIQKADALRSESVDKPKPSVYFEEWDDPIITGIQWVSELIELAGGKDCFSDHGKESLAKNRIVANHREVIDRRPDIIIGSWCGKKFRPGKVMERDGWHEIPAVKNGDVFEIKSCDILQPGPAALTDGLNQIKARIDSWREQRV